MKCKILPEKEKLRILHISNPVNIPAKGYGGTERVVYSLAKKQAENGHEVIIIAGKPSVIPGVKDISFIEGRPYVEKKFMMDRILTAYSLRAILKSRSYEFDIIHNHISEEAIPLSTLARAPVVTTLHCPMTLRRFWPFVTTSVSSLLPRKTKFVANSKRAFKAYQPFFGSDLITYIPNGIDISKIPFNPKPKKDHEIQLCFLGKFVPEKRPHLAIKVADLLYNQGYDLKLFIMGKMDFPLSSYAKRLLTSVGSKRYVDLLPNLKTEKIYEVLGNCDALIGVSYEIGLIIAHLEALATGTPIVGLINTSAEEVVRHGVTGYLCNNLRELAKNSLYARELDRRKCRLIVETEFSEKSMYEKYLNVYNLILDSA